MDIFVGINSSFISNVISNRLFQSQSSYLILSDEKILKNGINIYRFYHKIYSTYNMMNNSSLFTMLTVILVSSLSLMVVFINQQPTGAPSLKQRSVNGINSDVPKISPSV